MDFSNKTALITGAGQGVGEGIARALATYGANVSLVGRTLSKVQLVADEINKNGGSAIAIQCDVKDSKSINNSIESTLSHYKSLNILINNAGIGNGGYIESTDMDTWRLVHNVNLDSVFLGCKYSLPLMRDSGNGSIINISSMSGIVASHNTSAYNSSKAAVRHLSKSIALHCAKSTNLVRCNSIHPVFTRTAMVQSMIDAAPERDIEQKLIQQIPIRKLAEPIDIANAAIFLASDESSFITGTELLIDGGLSAT